MARMQLLIPRSRAAWAAERASTIVRTRERQRREALSLYRALLREGRRHERERDPVCGEYIAWRARDQFRRGARGAASGKVTASLAAARNGLRRVRAAHSGDAADAQRLIDLAYGRVGRVRHVMQAHIARAQSGGDVALRPASRGSGEVLPPTIARELSIAMAALRKEKRAAEAAHQATQLKHNRSGFSAPKKKDSGGGGRGAAMESMEAPDGEGAGARKTTSLPYPARALLALRGRLRWESRRTRRFYQKFIHFRPLAFAALREGHPDALAAAKVAETRLAKRRGKEKTVGGGGGAEQGKGNGAT